MTQHKVLDTPPASSCESGLPELLQLSIQEYQEAKGARSSSPSDPRLVRARRQEVTQPVIFVGAGTCGLGAGAAATLAAVQSYLQDHDLQADVVEVGCIGLCSAEPLVDIQLPGRTRVVFRKVTEEQVPKLLDAVLAGKIPESLMLGQFRHPTLPPWPDVPMLDEHPFLRRKRDGYWPTAD